MNYFKQTMSVAATCMLLAACQTEAPQTVHLKGQLLDMGTTNVPMRYDGAAAWIGDSRDILLHTDEEGRFDTIITLTEPAYYSISRNTLYLTPGDDLTIHITTNNQEAKFTGQGANVNNYMKFRLFPKGGSFLEGGSNVRANFAETKALVDSLATVRRAQLDTLSDASEEFKRLENARITADVANSYLSYPSYASFRQNEDAKDIDIDSFYLALKDDLVPALQALSEDPLLDVAVVRDVLSELADPGSASMQALSKEVNFTPRMTELYAAGRKVNRLRHEVDENTLNAIKAFTDSLQNHDFATELQAKTAQATRLLKGQPAIDIEFTDIDGQSHRLSDFKGKAIYLDFWATWCGPCIQESPYFEKLASKFTGKDIVFIPISTDTNREAWLQYLKAHKKALTQYNCIDEKLDSGWSILYIPRFVLIDRDFNIANAYAPRPSEPEAEAQINELLK